MKLTIQRPEPLLVTVASLRRTFVVEPPSRKAVRRALALDPPDDDEPSDPLVIDQRVSNQLRAIMERSGEVKEGVDHEDIREYDIDWESKLPLEDLTGEEERSLLRCMLAAHLGHDPAQGEAIHAALKKNAISMRVLQALAENSLQTGSSNASTRTPQDSPSISDAPSPKPSA